MNVIAIVGLNLSGHNAGFFRTAPQPFTKGPLRNEKEMGDFFQKSRSKVIDQSYITVLLFSARKTSVSIEGNGQV